MCSKHIPEDTHKTYKRFTDYFSQHDCSVTEHVRVVNIFQKTLTGGCYNESNYPMQELWW